MEPYAPVVPSAYSLGVLPLQKPKTWPGLNRPGFDGDQRLQGSRGGSLAERGDH